MPPSKYRIIKDSWGNRPNFQYSHGLKMDVIEEGNRILDEYIRHHDSGSEEEHDDDDRKHSNASGGRDESPPHQGHGRSDSESNYPANDYCDSEEYRYDVDEDADHGVAVYDGPEVEEIFEHPVNEAYPEYPPASPEPQELDIMTMEVKARDIMEKCTSLLTNKMYMTVRMARARTILMIRMEEIMMMITTTKTDYYSNVLVSFVDSKSCNYLLERHRQ
ncbi:hypothetical protein BT96DRAFT_1016126 [Gymnopus androsaceus JB14]|uniref:Uncharacterized protein n=1 Tax=Gymnopus androsaceus JB14 TaxID=1447944 RepID=A0A6A4I2Y8_9AGAR|nr:hypothetical protein BT96DRAFT_1016126 [Gymnopus androsaceus JB14]